MKLFAGQIRRPQNPRQASSRLNVPMMLVWNEIARPGDGTVHMRFRRQVHDVGDGVLLHDPQRRRLVAQIHLFKNVFRMLGNFFQIRQMARVSQAIQIDQLADARIVNDVMDEIRADEARAAGD